MWMMRAGVRPGFWGLLLLSAGVAGCSGSGAGLDANGRPSDSGGGAAGALTADFDSIQSHVFTPICTVCHAGAGAPEGLRLDSTNSYSLLVGVPSTEVPAIQRVTPGDPDNSYIIQKLEGHAAVGAQMPYGGPYLSADVIAAIRQWISDGAQRSAVPAAKALRAFGIVAVAPGSGEFLTQPPPQIMLEMNQEIDATRLGAATLRIQADAGEIPARIALPAANPRALIITPQITLPPGHYLVVLRPEPGYSLSSIAGAALAERVVTEFEVEALP